MKKRFIFIPVICILLSLSVPFVSLADGGGSLTFYPNSSYFIRRRGEMLAGVPPEPTDSITPYSTSYITNGDSLIYDYPSSSSYFEEAGSLLFFSESDSSPNAYIFVSDYTYQIDFTLTVKVALRSGSSFTFPSDFLSLGLYPNLGSSSSYPLNDNYILSSLYNNLTYSYTVSSVDNGSTSNITRTIYTINSSVLFHIPSDYNSVYTLFGFLLLFNPLDMDTTSSSTNAIQIYAPYTTFASCAYDPGNTIIPDNGDDILSGITDLNDSIQSGFSGLESAIHGDGSFGSPESDAVGDIDNYIDYESSMLDDLGYDTLDADNFMENVLDVVDFDDIDIPTQSAGNWFHAVLNPVMTAFPFFVIFPLIVGLLGTLLGRRAR